MMKYYLEMWTLKWTLFYLPYLVYLLANKNKILKRIGDPEFPAEIETQLIAYPVQLKSPEQSNGFIKDTSS